MFPFYRSRRRECVRGDERISSQRLHGESDIGFHAGGGLITLQCLKKRRMLVRARGVAHAGCDTIILLLFLSEPPMIGPPHFHDLALQAFGLEIKRLILNKILKKDGARAPELVGPTTEILHWLQKVL